MDEDGKHNQSTVTDYQHSRNGVMTPKQNGISGSPKNPGISSEIDDFVHKSIINPPKNSGRFCVAFWFCFQCLSTFW